MTSYLFLKADRDTYMKGPGRTRSNAGIDPVLLLLLTARYI